MTKIIDEVICVHCEHEIDDVEGLVMVNGGYLCDSYCLADYLQTHGIVALQTGRD